MLRSLYYVNLNSHHVYRTTGDGRVTRIGRFERHDDEFRLVDLPPETFDAGIVEELLFAYIGADRISALRDALNEHCLDEAS